MTKDAMVVVVKGGGGWGRLMLTRFDLVCETVLSGG